MKNFSVLLLSAFLCVKLMDFLDVCSRASGRCGELVSVLQEQKLDGVFKELCLQACLFPNRYLMEREDIFLACVEAIEKGGGK